MQLNQLATPCYVYNMQVLQQTLKACSTHAARYNYKVHYALKANVQPQVLKEVLAHGFGADCVSGFEVNRAIEAGFSPAHVTFAGVGKSDDEILAALKHGIYCFNVESLQELKVINTLAAQLASVAPVAIRINPNVHAGTHKNITTGLSANKFGINAEDITACIRLLQTLPHLRFLGIHFHIGSQITHPEVFANLCVKVNDYFNLFSANNLTPGIVNVGGGLGVNYESPEGDVPDFETYFATFHKHLVLPPGVEVHFELGRSLVAQCGSILSRVLYVKTGHTTSFLVLDAGMTELMRPALYQARHKITNLSRKDMPANTLYEVVGPICETTDTFGSGFLLPQTQRGDLMQISSAGAYGQVLSSTYNLRPLAPAWFTHPD